MGIAVIVVCVIGCVIGCVCWLCIVSCGDGEGEVYEDEVKTPL